MATINRPVAFPGTPEQAAANRLTHSFDYDEDYGTGRCMFCDSKPWHVAADYPCGEEPPREEVTV